MYLLIAVILKKRIREGIFFDSRLLLYKCENYVSLRAKLYRSSESLILTRNMNRLFIILLDIGN